MRLVVSPWGKMAATDRRITMFIVYALLCVWVNLISSVDQVVGKTVSQINIPHDLPVNSIITKISVSGNTPLVEHLEEEASELFKVLEGGELITTGDLSKVLGRTFTFFTSYPHQKSSVFDILLLNIHNSSDLFTFTQHHYLSTIKENQPHDTIVDVYGHIQAQSKSSSDVKYSIISGNQDLFYLRHMQYLNSHEVKIVAKNPLDRENCESYSLVIEATSSSGETAQAVITVNVADLNDNVPIFEKEIYKVIYNSDVNSRTKILQVHATDADIDRITYSLQGSSEFWIDQNSGEIFAKSEAHISTGVHTFSVTAQDSAGHISAPSTVIIEIIPSVLKFESFHKVSKRSVTHIEKQIQVMENGSSSDVLFSVASSPAPPPGVEQYRIVSATAEKFQVDTKGNVYVKQGKSLDYENVEDRSITITFNVTRTDQPQDFTLKMINLKVNDRNDEKPVFINMPRPFLATVSTNPSSRELVYELMAEDPDTNSQIEYILESGGDSKFRIDNVIVRNRRVGKIVTAVSGNGQFIRGREYELVVSARDMGVSPAVQKSNFEIVKVLVGKRPPQFFMNPYVAYITENNRPGYKLVTKEGNPLKIMAKPFQSRDPEGGIQFEGSVTFQLLDENNQSSSLFSIGSNGEVDALQSLDYEDRTTHTFSLLVIGREESSQMESSTQLKVHLVDVNDNDPIFQLSTYTDYTSEGTAVDTMLFSVTATDRDSGKNAQLTYSVSDDHFKVETRNDTKNNVYVGDIKVAKQLDYDFITDHLYKFNVTVTDNGIIPRSGWARIVIYITNINDEKPRFRTGLEEIYFSIREDQTSGSYVTTIQASDPDNDKVEYYFTDKRLTAPNGPFAIDPTSGLITLTSSIPPSVSSYTLNITAYDDGSCCGGYPKLHRDSYIVVEVKDINNNNPEFPSCKYAPEVMENQDIGTRVIDIVATDDDRGRNGEITYSVIVPPGQQQYFEINPQNGTLYTAQRLDRESQQGLRGYSVTVKAEDNGEPQRLNSLCTFWVRVGDQNDNPPKFDSTSYSQKIQRNFALQELVTKVYATDKDQDKNAEVSYFLIENPGSYFQIDQDTGVISLAKSVSGISQEKEILLVVMAQDKGTPPLNANVSVTITVTMGSMEAPTWDESYDGRTYTVPETQQMGYTIAKMSATSSVPPPLDGVSFSIVKPDGSTTQVLGNFRIVSSDKEMKLKLNRQLNYTENHSYTLRLRAENQGLSPLSREIRVTVIVKDMNNLRPVFEGLDKQLSNSYRGSVPENEPVYREVINVRAVDGDHDPPNNVVKYNLFPDRYNVYQLFTIDSTSGLIKTNTTFDREKQKVYYLIVEAKDGKPSDMPFHEPPNTPNSATATVQVIIGDKNDNPPVIDQPLYTKSVQEQPPDSSKSILKVTATDKDDADILAYTITDGNYGNVFGIKQKTGDIYVINDLDYETPPNIYNLTVTVSDGYHTSRCRVVLTVLDINDNAPEFQKPEYIVDNVVEEVVPPLPEGQFLLQVNATDRDIARAQYTKFKYSLNTDDKDKNNPTFRIEPNTGKIYQMKKLDRDLPNGRPEYQFNVLVEDEPESNQALIGYAIVKVKPKDINDNAPVFPDNLVGKTPENTFRDHQLNLGKNRAIMTVRAVDYDLGNNGSVYYEIDRLSNPPVDSETGDYLFLIDPQTGLLKTNTNKLDREKLDHYTLKIIAKDKGTPQQTSNATITIKIEDVNDERPVFVKKIYRTTLSESQKSGPVITVSATDDDIGDNAKLTYSLSEDLSFFAIETLPSNAGVIQVFSAKGVDYENPNERFFNLTVKAKDPNPSHEDTAYVEITVTDANDEAPVFSEKVKTMEKVENIKPETLLYTFTASDKDSPPNNKFTFSIGEDSFNRFYVEQEGDKCHVKIQRGLDGETLDRESQEFYTVKVVATDVGDPPLSGEATLRIDVTDLNDNAPDFASHAIPKIMEEEDPPQTVTIFSAVDRDTKKYGGPFTFRLPPCDENPTCNRTTGKQDFVLQFDPNGDGGNGIGTVTSTRKFLREVQKFYYLPIIMTDLRGRPPIEQMSATRTLTIEIDDKNNNQHFDGTKEIFVYNYKGMFGNIEIGTANAQDLDDKDSVDKYYYFVRPDHMKKFFSVNQQNGSITMLKGVPSGTFEFEVKVYDHVVFTKKNATATIRVTVQEITDDAVFSSGSIRLIGTTKEKFVEKKLTPGNPSISTNSSYENFRSLLAKKLDVPYNNVEIFSVMDNGIYTDIRYAAHGSPYYTASKLDGIVLMHKDEFAQAADATIVMVNIDECVKEICESGGCSNILKVDEKRPNLVNTKGKSFVGVRTYVVPECTCRARNFSNPLGCYPGYCLNGGNCQKDDWGDISCTCPSGFDGKRCQETHHTFNDGYALYPNLAQCEDSVTSIEFVTKHENGLLFYNGPVQKLDNDDPRDFIALELNGGYPKLIIDHGTGILPLHLDGKDANGNTKMQKLNDGSWHHIDVIREGKNVKMVVDHCEKTEFQSGSESIEDRKPCEISGSTKGRNKYLNVNTMLQLGGRYTKPPYPPSNSITDARFKGCIRNLVHNGELYDLHTSKNHPGENHENRCGREDDICNSAGGLKCGPHGICEMINFDQLDVKCTCEPGYRTANANSIRCDTATTIRDLHAQSYMTWILKGEFFNILQDRKTQMQMRFRTRDANGILLHLPSNSNEAITLEIVNSHVRVTYNLRDYATTESYLSLSDAPASNGQWHTVYVKRIGRWFQLKMDSGEGRYYNETMGKPSDSQLFSMRRDHIVAGAHVVFDPQADFGGKGLTKTCITDIRVDEKWFPMKTEENPLSPAAELEDYPNVAMGCVRDDCAGIQCPEGAPIPKQCYPLWGKQECRCPPGSQPGIGQGCIGILYCPNNPCYSGGTCIEQDFPETFKCLCPPGWKGALCNQLAVTEVASGGVKYEVFIIVAVSLLVVILIALFVFLVARRLRKNTDDKAVLYDDQYDDIRENLAAHDEEGAGEEDQDGYDISRLRKPEGYNTSHIDRATYNKPLGRAPPGEGEDVEHFIDDRLRDADDDPGAPPHDNVMEFAYEGGSSDAGSLSSLNTGTSEGDQDYDYLNDWGPKFSKLANMYGLSDDDL